MNNRNKRLALIPVTGLVLLTLAGCGNTTPHANGAHNHQVANSTTTTSGSDGVPSSTGSTNNTASNSGNTASSTPADSTTTSQSNYTSEIALIRNKGYSVDETTPNATVKTKSGDNLTAWITSATQSQDGYSHLVFFFLNGKYLGTDTAQPSLQITSAKAVGNGIAVTYPVYKKNDAFADPTGTPVTITYTWSGSKLVPNKPYPNQFHAGNPTGQGNNSIATKSYSTSTFQQIFKSFGASNQVFLGGSIGFQVTNIGGGMNNFMYQFSKTTDGGKTWTKVSTGHYSHVQGISFINEKTGYLLNNSPAYAITPDLFVTHDGGVSWNEQKLPIPSAYRNAYRTSNYPIFFSPTVGFIPIYGQATQQSTTSQFLYMLVTTDGGTSWTAYTQNQGDGLSWSLNGQKLKVIDGVQTITIDGLLGGSWTVSTRITN